MKKRDEDIGRETYKKTTDNTVKKQQKIKPKKKTKGKKHYYMHKILCILYTMRFMFYSELPQKMPYFSSSNNS